MESLQGFNGVWIRKNRILARAGFGGIGGMEGGASDARGGITMSIPPEETPFLLLFRFGWLGAGFGCWKRNGGMCFLLEMLVEYG